MIKLILNQTPLIKLSGRLIKVFVDEYINELNIASHQHSHYLSSFVTEIDANLVFDSLEMVCWKESPARILVTEDL